MLLKLDLYLYMKLRIRMIQMRFVSLMRELLGYVPRYYAGAFVKFITEGRIEECHVTNVEKADCCDECIGIQIKIAGVKR